jgi:spermidine/putrescine transport system ATP-binding protein
MTVAENLEFGLKMKNVASNKIKQKIFEILSLVRLEGMQDRFPEQLSGGQMQRVALARSLVLEPKVLLLDEPLAALDRKLRKEMQVELKQIHKDVGLTFLYVTHDQKVALGISDRIGIMRDGKIDQIGSPTDLYQNPKTKFVADFMGGTNILEVKRIDREFENQFYFETNGGLKIKANIQNDSRADISAVSIRPEKIKLYQKEENVKEDNTLQGTILTVVYQGDFTEVGIILENRKEKMVVHYFHTKGVSATEKWLSIGQQVALGWDSLDTIPLKP